MRNNKRSANLIGKKILTALYIHGAVDYYLLKEQVGK